VAVAGRVPHSSTRPSPGDPNQTGGGQVGPVGGAQNRHLRAVLAILAQGCLGASPSALVKQRARLLAMDERPVTRYADVPDGVNIAYRVIGDGPLDLVALSGLGDILASATGRSSGVRHFGSVRRLRHSSIML